MLGGDHRASQHITQLLHRAKSCHRASQRILSHSYIFRTIRDSMSVWPSPHLPCYRPPSPLFHLIIISLVSSVSLSSVSSSLWYPPPEKIACTPPTCLHLCTPMLWTKSTIMRKILPWPTTTTLILLLKRMMMKFAHLRMAWFILPPLALPSQSTRFSVMPKVVPGWLKVCICSS